MATIEYKCDTCKREITLLENTQGMTVFAKCVITEGCKGILYKVARNPNAIRQNEGFASPVTGLDDYIPRRAFYEANINISANPWKIKHNLGVSPATTVYWFNDITGLPYEVSPDEYSISIVDEDNIEISFSNQRKGIAHLIARSSIPRNIETIIDLDNLIRVSNNGNLDMAIPSIINDGGTSRNITNDNAKLSIEMNIPNNTVQATTGEYLIDGAEDNSAWSGWNEILLRQRRNFSTKTFNVETPFVEVFSNISSINDVPDNTIFRITEINLIDDDTSYESGNIKIEPRLLFLLLSRSPFKASDRIQNKIVDVGELLISNTNYFVIIGGEIYVNNENIETIYPQIRRVS